MLSQGKNKLLRRLHERKGRRKEALVLVEGVRCTREALSAGARVRFAVQSEEFGAAAEEQELLSELHTAGVAVEGAGPGEFDEISATEHAQGILLVCEEEAHDLSGLNVGGGCGFLLLDGVQDPGNVGTLVRTAAAFDLGAVITLEGTADPWGAKAVRASAGACFRLPMIRETTGRVRAWLEESGIPILLADAHGTDPSLGPEMSSWALVVGSERAGAGDELRAAAHRTLAVPMPGEVESLNAAMAGAILMFQLSGSASES